MLIRLLVVSAWTCCKGAVYRSCVCFPFWAVPQWSVDAFFCNFRVQVGDDGGTILLFLLDGCFFPAHLRCYLVWRFFSHDIWAYMPRATGRVKDTHSCWSWCFATGFCRRLVGLRRGGVPCGSCSWGFRIIIHFSRQRKNQMRRRRISFVLSDNLLQSMGRCHRSMLILLAVVLYMRNWRSWSSCICWSMIGAGVFATILWNFLICTDAYLGGKIWQRMSSEQKMRWHNVGTVFWRRKRHFPMNCWMSINAYLLLPMWREMMATWLCVLQSLSFFTQPGGCRSGKWGTVTRSEQRMRLLGVGIALWLRRRQWAKSCCQATLLSLVRPTWRQMMATCLYVLQSMIFFWRHSDCQGGSIPRLMPIELRMC